MKYDVDYFYNKFVRIPEEKWCRFQFKKNVGYESKHCVYGHCGIRGYSTNIEKTKEGKALYLLGKKYKLDFMGINDDTEIEFQQPTPRQRVLAALLWIKSKQEITEAQSIINKPIVVVTFL